MADTDVSVRFSGDTSALNNSVNQARQTLAAFAPGATGQAKGSLDAFNASLRDGKSAADGAAGSWRENLAVLADITIVAGGAKAAVAGLFSGIGAVAKADFQADADAIHAIGAAAAGAVSDTKGEADALLGFFTSAATSAQGARLLTQANDGVRASIGRVIAGIQNYFATAALLRDGTIEAQTAALAAAGNFDRFSQAVHDSGNSFGTTLDTLTHFTGELARIPGMTRDVAASIEATIGALPNYDVGSNDLIIKYLQSVSTNADDAKAKVEALAKSFSADNATGGADLATSLLSEIDFTKLDEAKGKIQDLVVLARSFGQGFAKPEQAKAFFDTLIQKADQYGTAAMQPLREQLEAFEKLGPLGQVLELGIQGQVNKQVALNTELATALRTMQQQATAAGATADAIKRQGDYEKLIDEGSTRVGRRNAADDNIKLLNSNASQGRKNDDADVGGDRDLLIRTLIGEAGSQGAEGMAAVANVIKNRVESAFDGMKTYRDVIAEGNGKQFNSYRDSDPSGQRARSLGTDSPEYQKAAAIVDKLAAGQLDDNTNGATSFYNPKTASNAFPLTNKTQVGDHVFGNTSGSPPVRGDDEDDERTERLQQQLDAKRKIADEARGGTQADLADTAALQQQAAGLHDLVAQAQAKLVATQKDADAAKGGSPDAVEAATKKVVAAQVELAEKTEAARKAQADLAVAQLQPNSAGRLAAQLAEYSAEEAAASGNVAKIAELEKSKIEAQKAYDDQRKAESASTEDANFANLQSKLKEQASLIQEQGKVGQLTQAEERSAQASNLAQQLAAEKAHYAALEQIWGEGTTQYRKAAQQLLEVDQKNAAERQRATQLANTQVYDSYRHEFERIGSTVSNSLVGIIEGTSNFRTLMQNVSKQILAQFVDMGVKTVADWASRQAAQLVLTTTGQAAQTSAVATGTAARETLSAAGLGATATATVTSVLGSIEASAAETFAGIFGFLSPVLGPAAAGPAAAGQAAVAAVAGSFAVGAWSLPNDMVAQVHAGEMIVPAGPAALMRAAAGGGATQGGRGSAGGGGDLHTHFHVTAMDSRDVRRFFSDNSKHILGAINDGLRTGSHLGLSKLRSPFGV